MSEPLTPVQVEAKIRSLVNDIALAELDLRRLRRVHADAQIAEMNAQIRAWYDPDCPQPDRKAGVLAGDKDMWVKRAIKEEAAALISAESDMESGRDSLRSKIAQLNGVQTLSSSVRQAYSMAGQS